MALLGVVWAEVVAVAMRPLPVVERDPLRGGQRQLGDTGVSGPVVDEFIFEVGVHRFGQRIVVTITDRTYRRSDPLVSQTLPERDGSILRTSVPVMDKCAQINYTRTLSAIDSVGDGRVDEMGGQRLSRVS